MENNALNITTYNCNVLSDRKVSFIRQLFESCDVLLLQEHGLYKSMFHKLKQINDDVCYSGSSAMVESQALVGRPHGGTAILWRSNIGFKVTPISCESVRLSSVMLNINSLVSFLIINVYMPCDERRTGDNLNEYLEILQEISCLIHKYNPTHFTIGGDFNTDITRHSPCTEAFTDFIEIENCKYMLANDKFDVDFTYTSNDGKHNSNIDHILVCENLESCVLSYYTTDTVDNVSDHVALSCVLDLYVDYVESNIGSSIKHSVWSNITQKYIDRYQKTLDNKLKHITIKDDLLLCKDYLCTKHNVDINNLYGAIVNACIGAAEETIPQSEPTKMRGKKPIPQWNELIDPHRQRAIFWHEIWKDQGRPQCGIVSEIRRTTRARYHLEIRKVKASENAIRNQSLAEKIVNNDTKNLWSEIKQLKRNTKCNPRKIDDVSGDQAIADLFANNFSKLYNSVSFDSVSMTEMQKQIADDITCKCKHSDRCCNHIDILTVNDITCGVKMLKRNKRDGTLNLFTDNLIHGTNRLFVLLSILLTAIVVHGYSPYEMLYGVMTPIPKVSGTTDSSNFRAITLCTTMSKLMDVIVLKKCKNVLYTSDLQFGFKPQSSTTYCTFAVQEIINFYNSQNTNVYCTLLDASKGFDRIEFCMLFKKLIRRGMCPLIVRLLMFMYTNQLLYVKWNGCLSKKISSF